MFKVLKKSLSSIISSTFILALLVFAPATFALDPLAFSPTPEAQYTTGEDPYEVNVAYVVQDAALDTKFEIKRKGGLTYLIGTHKFTFYNEKYKFEWDGKIDNKQAPAGDYEVLILSGNSEMLSHEFNVKNPPEALTPVLSFNNPPKDIFNNQSQPTADFQVRLNQFDQDVNIKFQIKPENQNAFDVKTIKYTQSGTNVFSWDGKKAGQDVAPGSYEAIFSGEGISPISYLFNVVSAEPKISFTTNPPAQFALSSADNYKISVNLAGYANDTKVTASVVLSDNNIPIPQTDYTYKANGSHELSWDVSEYKPGTYTLTVKGEDTKKNITNTLEHEFTIVSSQPTLSFNPTPSSTYTLGSGDYKFFVKLNGFTSDTLVSANIVDPNSALDIPKDNFTFTANDQSHQFAIDMSAYQPGDYEMNIYGTDKDDIQTNTLTQKIKVMTSDESQDNSTSTSESCAGYKDLKKTDWSCEAAIWAKGEGIMTGQEGGEYFDGFSYMNRAQEAKIALMAYKKYTAGTDYCKGKLPFPDVRLGQWYSDFICLGQQLKMITGYLSGPAAGQYLPPKPVTVPEMFCILVRPLNEPLPAGPSYPGLESSQWYSGCAKYVKDHGYYSASTLSPFKEATRFEALNFLYALHKDGKL